MKIILSIVICAVSFVSCNKIDSEDHLEILKDKFHGKYELVSSISKELLDLNMDGIASNDLLSENPQLARSGIEVFIIDSDHHLFEEKWATENHQISRDELFDPNKVYTTEGLYYGMYINMSSFIFNEDFKTIQLLDGVYTNEVNTLISFESVVFEGNEIVKVTTIRKLYTKKGWVTTEIISRYKRFTTLT